MIREAIKDKNFDLVKEYVLDKDTSDSGFNISPFWITKSAITDVVARLRKVKTGLQINGVFPKDNYGYIYLRQILPNVLRFSKARTTVEIKVINDSPDEVYYDLYLQCRFDKYLANRVQVHGRDRTLLPIGESVVRIPVEFPDISNKTEKSGEGLSLAFRLVGMNARCMVVVQEISMMAEEVEKLSLWQKIIKWFKELL